MVMVTVVGYSRTLPAQTTFGSENIIADASNSAQDAQDVFAVDLDGDGDMDVLSASAGDDKIGWFENNGRGTFSALQMISDQAHHALSVYAGDLDGDGDVDVLSGDAQRVAWYAQLSSGQFSEKHVITNDAAYYASVNAVDLDQDGDLDVLATNASRIVWFENDGHGFFGPQQVISYLITDGHSVRAADVDGDGDLDVVGSCGWWDGDDYWDDKVAWYENLGGGTFGPQQIISTAISYDICVADMDDDGDFDVLTVRSLSNSIGWVENAGGGNFELPKSIANGLDGGTGIHAADLDGDGDLDVISASRYDNTVAWIENLGGGSFGEERIISVKAQYAQSVHTADLDGDGRLDVVSASAYDHKIAWYRNLGDGEFSPQIVLTKGAVVEPRSVFAADMDGDGDNDILSSSEGDDKIAWHENLGCGFFGPQNVISFSVKDARSIFAADLDGDGDIDVLCGSSWPSGYGLIWLENRGASEFSSPRVISTTPGVLSVFATDLDGDGDTDVLGAARYTDHLEWSEHVAYGNFGLPQSISTTVESERSVYAADLDGDGDVDVLSTNPSDRQLTWYENLGSGLFGPGQIVATMIERPVAICAADMDGDGDFDVLGASGQDGVVAWYENDGSGGFGTTPEIITASAPGVSSLFTKDMDADGDIDVLSAYHSFTPTDTVLGVVAWHENLGSGMFSTQHVVSSSAHGAIAVFASDLDGDGDQDILSASREDDKIAWYENQLIAHEETSFCKARPNPASSELYVYGFGNAVLINASGHTVWSGPVDGVRVISVAGWSPGIYVLTWLEADHAQQIVVH